MEKKLRVGVIFGGRSVEHEISLLSARSIFEHLNRDRYEAVPIGITREGKWVTSSDAGRLLDRGLDSEDQNYCFLPPDPSTQGLIQVEESAFLGPVRHLDVIFPVLHGGQGEDGTLQGLLELANLPYVGAGVMASSVGMDKDVMKRVFRDAGLAVTPHHLVLRKDWDANREQILSTLPDQLTYPCFIKPANTGSSVGITKVREGSGLEDGLDLAFRYDRKAVVETGVDAREIECSVLGNEDPIASVPGEILPCHEFYDYSAKYLKEGSELVVPADLEAAVTRQVQDTAVAAFKCIDGAGMARVDFFLERKTNQVLINEVNTIPGFTPISMYPQLWQASGISYPELLDRLIQLAFERYREKERSETRLET